MASETDITQLARRWSAGEEGALEALIEVTYPKLRRIAHRHLGSEAGDPTIETSALVHEAYIRFAAESDGAWPSRAHFYAFCSKVMRRVLVDYARRRRARKRGGALVRVPLSDDVAAVDAEAADVLRVEEALEFLAARDRRLAEVVECRFFGGLSIADTAEALDTSPRTIVREWTRARAYLLRALADVDVDGRDGGTADAGGDGVQGQAHA